MLLSSGPIKWVFFFALFLFLYLSISRLHPLITLWRVSITSNWVPLTHGKEINEVTSSSSNFWFPYVHHCADPNTKSFCKPTYQFQNDLSSQDMNYSRRLISFLVITISEFIIGRSISRDDRGSAKNRKWGTRPKSELNWLTNWKGKKNLYNSFQLGTNSLSFFLSGQQIRKCSMFVYICIYVEGRRL